MRGVCAEARRAEAGGGERGWGGEDVRARRESRAARARRSAARVWRSTARAWRRAWRPSSLPPSLPPPRVYSPPLRSYEAIDVMNLNHWPMSQCFDADVSNSELGVTSLSWCAGRYEPPLLAVGGSSGSVSVWQFSENNRAWSVAYSLPSHNRGVLDVKWAPNVGRSFHLIASTGKDGLVRVNKLKRKVSASWLRSAPRMQRAKCCTQVVRTRKARRDSQMRARF